MGAITDHFGMFVSGYWRSLVICLWALVGTLVLGTAIAACRVAPLAPLRAFGTGYVSIIRNCPLAVTLFFIAFGLPELGVHASYYLFGISGLVLYTAAFVCEAIRSGINAVPGGQAEAARALGLTFTQNLRVIILPQAFRSAVPPLASVLIAMFKNSAVLGAFGVGGDLYANGNELVSADGYDATIVFAAIAVGYLLITIPAGLVFGYLERKAVIAR